MTSHSMSFGRPLRAHPASSTQWLGQFTEMMLKALRQIDRWQLGQRQEQPRSAQDVLDWADRLQSREPGFASDLRAAALRSMNERSD